MVRVFSCMFFIFPSKKDINPVNINYGTGVAFYGAGTAGTTVSSGHVLALFDVTGSHGTERDCSW